MHDDGRAAIDMTIPAGGGQAVELTVAAPDLPGSYQLELDVLQEHKGWFAALGSPTLRVPVLVTPSPQAPETQAPRHPPAEDAILVPRIEMHVMSREEVVAVIEEAGGTVLDVIARDRCGPSAPSYDYVVGRSPTPGGPSPRTPAGPSEDRPAPLAAPIRPLPSEGLWTARAEIARRADLVGFALSSRRRLLGQPSILARRLLRRALLEVLYRQTEFNRAGITLIEELERQVEQLQTRARTQDQLLADAGDRIARLEQRVQPAPAGLHLSPAGLHPAPAGEKPDAEDDAGGQI